MLEIIFQYGPFTVRTFNLCVALGVFLGGVFLVRYSLRRKMNFSFLTRALLPILSASVVAGRLTYALENPELFAGPAWPALFQIWDLGFSFFGFLLGAAVALFALSQGEKEPIWSWVDAFTLSLLVVLFFVHIGQFFSGANYGLPTDLPWGIRFNAQNIRYLTPIHPTQLYSALFTAGLFFYSLKKDRRVHLPGITGTQALMIYGLAMAAVDFLHADGLWYTRIAFLALSSVSFILLVHCSHKSHIPSQS